MLKSTLIAGAVALAMLNGTPSSSERHHAVMDLDPALNGAVSASGVFPSQGMEDAFRDYLRWTKAEGLSRLTAFETSERTLERAMSGEASASGRFPSQDMEEEFKRYLAWTDDTGQGLFYAFRVTDFN